MQLYCFPCAGGSAVFFDFLDPYIGSDIDVTKLEYSGHGGRYKEKLYEDFSELAEDMYFQVCSRHKENEAYAFLVTAWAVSLR